jgi:Prp8 binding protein
MHLASWDVETGERIRRHPGHEEVVNCMDVSKRGEEMLVSGSDDGSIGVSAPVQFQPCMTDICRYGTRGRKRP